MIPPIADSDPDPTTQIAWPATRSQVSDQPLEPSGGESTGSGEGDVDRKRSTMTSGKRQLTNWDLITLSISMAGAQIAWTVELG
jgi:solute carrier family 45, member 1/2/4